MNFIELLSLPVQMNEKSKPTLSFVQVKKRRLILDDKDEKTKERILRNRVAAQESRDKKRKYITDLEEKNKKLKKENELIQDKIQILEEQNNSLHVQFDTFIQQLNLLQAQIKLNSINPILFHDFCDSARIAGKRVLNWFILFLRKS